MEAFAVLVLLPILIGIVSELLFRDTAHASFAAAIATTLAAITFFVAARNGDPAG